MSMPYTVKHYHTQCRIYHAPEICQAIFSTTWLPIAHPYSQIGPIFSGFDGVGTGHIVGICMLYIPDSTQFLFHLSNDNVDTLAFIGVAGIIIVDVDKEWF